LTGGRFPVPGASGGGLTGFRQGPYRWFEGSAEGNCTPGGGRGSFHERSPCDFDVVKKVFHHPFSFGFVLFHIPSLGLNYYLLAFKTINAIALGL
jgi:hypothetical protein